MPNAVGNHVVGKVEKGAEGHERSGYAIDPVGSWHWPTLAASAVLGTWLAEHSTDSVSRRGPIMIAAMIAVFVAMRPRLIGRGAMVVSILLVLVLAAWRSDVEWRAVRQPSEGRFEGVVQVASDPQVLGRGVKLLFEIEGRRHQSLLYGANSAIASRLSGGDWVFVRGVKRRSDSNDHRSQVRHIVGEFEVSSISVPEGGVRRRTRTLERTANDVRSILSRGASVMSPEDAALFRGLVYGDDSGQSKETVTAFRSSGLAHLTAVSGQNVGYLLTVLGPFLRRRERWSRMTMTLLALVWFAVLTRVEPSVVRAAGMAGISAVAFAVGVRSRSIDILCGCVGLFVLVDPFLVWSVGWWLSVGGTLGLISLTPFVHRVIRRPDGRRRRMADWMAPTIAAQAGVFPVSLLVFGWPNAWSVPANLLAAPVAGFVMLIGFPTALLAGMVPAVAHLVMFPSSLAVRWVALVAETASSMRPMNAVNVLGVVAVPLMLWALGRSSRHRYANLG